MYLCKLNLIIVSKSITIEAALKTTALPEDCEISVSTVPELTEKQDKEDTVVIFDSVEAFEKGTALVGAKSKSALIIESAELSNASKTAKKPIFMAVVSDFGDTEMLVYYAESLIRDMKMRFDYRLQTICFNTAFDSIPDLVWFKDVKGAHLCVNNGFCEAVAKTKEQIYKKGHYYIWDIPKEEYDQGDYVCLESEEVVMNARKTCRFDENVKTKKGMRQFKTYKSPLIDEDGTIFGTCGIANDVTAHHNINSELKVILDSMPFAVIVDDDKENIIAANRLFYQYFPEFKGIVGTNISAWKNSVIRGKLEDSVIEVETENGMITVSCQVKPIYSIFNEKIGNAIILTDITGERKRLEENSFNANTDSLTGLANRRRLFEYLDSIKYSPKIAVINADLDNLKRINEEYGYTAGDSALKLTADVLRKTFPVDFIARISGDDFIVVINGDCSAEELKSSTEEFLHSLRRAVSENKEFAGLGASVGIAVSEKGSDKIHEPETLLKESDKALNDAKHSEGDKISGI